MSTGFETTHEGVVLMDVAMSHYPLEMRLLWDAMSKFVQKLQAKPRISVAKHGLESFKAHVPNGVELRTWEKDFEGPVTELGWRCGLDTAFSREVRLCLCFHLFDLSSGAFNLQEERPWLAQALGVVVYRMTTSVGGQGVERPRLVELFAQLREMGSASTGLKLKRSN